MLQLPLLFPRYSLRYALSAAPQGIEQQRPLRSEDPLALRTIGVCKSTDSNPEKARTLCPLDIGCTWVQQELHIQDMSHIHLPHATVTEFLGCSCTASLLKGVRCQGISQSSHLTCSENAEGPALPTCGRYSSEAAGDIPFPSEVRSSSSGASLSSLNRRVEHQTLDWQEPSLSAVLKRGEHFYSPFSQLPVLLDEYFQVIVSQIIFFCLLKGYLSFVF